MAARPNPAPAGKDTGKRAEPARPPRHLRAPVPRRGGLLGTPQAPAARISCLADSIAGAPANDTASVRPEPVLLVAACAGPRCRGLRVLHDPSAAASGPSGQLLGNAVRRRPGAVLLSTGCLGPCQRGCIAAVGWAVSAGGQLRWSGRPVGLGMVETPPRAAALAAWIAGTAPDLTTLPEPLWRIGAT